MDETLWYRIAVALGIGFIVGLERGWQHRDQQSGLRQAGLRTFALAGLLGGVLAALSLPDRFAVLAAGMIVVGAFVVVGYVVSAREHDDFGMTTELALLATFALGAYAVLGGPFEAAAAGIVMTLLLSFKAEFHSVIDKLERHELQATLQLAAIAAVLVPLLPNRDVGPWESINPRVVGVLVLLVAALSYVGYFAVRMLGARLGLILTALFGGLASSTAVAVAYARRARADSSNQALLGTGIALAAATMVPRIAIELTAVNRALVADLWPTLVTVAIVPLIAVGYALRTSRHASADTHIKLGNPLQLSSALTFGLLLIALFVASAGLHRTFGDSGAYAVAAIAALLDVDAPSLALAEAAAKGTLDRATASRAIAVAVLVNTGIKGVLAVVLGGPAMLRSAAAVLAATVVAGGVTAVATL